MASAVKNLFMTAGKMGFNVLLKVDGFEVFVPNVVVTFFVNGNVMI